MNINENNFIRELKYRNPDALDYFIEAYGALIKGITTKILYSLGNSGAIEECMSDIFMAVWTNINKYDEDKGNFKGWLTAVAKFKAIDYLRKHTREIKGEIIEETLTNGRSAEDDFLVQAESEGIVGIIEALEEPDRTIFVMKFLLGEKVKTISEAVNLSVSSVNTRISRGRERLRRQYYKSFKGGAL